jgi:oxygen-dependent protoporphyrinogen oxidase
MSSTFPDAGFAPPDHVAIRCMIGGAHDPAAAALSDEELIRLSRDALRRLMSIDAAPTFSHVIKWPRAIPQYEVGHRERVEAIEGRGAALGVFSTGAALRGIGVNDVIREAAALASRLA